MYNDVARASAKTMWTNQKNNKPGKNRVEKRKKKKRKKISLLVCTFCALRRTYSWIIKTVFVAVVFLEIVT